MLSKAEHETSSIPHRRLACGPVNRSPGISRNSLLIRRSRWSSTLPNAGDASTLAGMAAAAGVRRVT
jgi:hypothetical protein